MVPSVCACVRPSMHGPFNNDKDYTVASFCAKLGRHVIHNERMDIIDFGANEKYRGMFEVEYCTSKVGYTSDLLKYNMWVYIRSY